MKLKEFKEYVNSLSEELDDLEILAECYDIEKGITLRDVKSLNVVRYKEKENIYTDSFDGTLYTSTVKEETISLKNSNKGLKICFYRSK